MPRSQEINDIGDMVPGNLYIFIRRGSTYDRTEGRFKKFTRNGIKVHFARWGDEDIDNPIDEYQIIPTAHRNRPANNMRIHLGGSKKRGYGRKRNTRCNKSSKRCRKSSTRRR